MLVFDNQKWIHFNIDNTYKHYKANDLDIVQSN